MRFKHFFLAAACLATLALGADIAQADNHFTTAADLKRNGIDAKEFKPVCFSPDGRSILGVLHNGKEGIAQGKKYSFAVMDIDNKLAISKVRLYDIDIPFIEQVSYTPDGKAVVFTSRSGATFQKLDLTTGKVSTILEHKVGQPGFRCYPLVIAIYNDQLIVNGFFYDKDDYAERNSVAVLDPNKTGVEAFTKIAEVQKAQSKARRDANFHIENLISTKYAFFTDDLGGDVEYHVWDLNDKELNLKTFDKGYRSVGLWSFSDRLLYSLQRSKTSFDLMLYDANTNKKVEIATSKEIPYRNLFLSQDGKTAIFSEFNKNDTRTRTFYAREDEGWQVKPIEGYHELGYGLQRLSNDGKRMFLFTDKGMRIFDVK